MLLRLYYFVSVSRLVSFYVMHYATKQSSPWRIIKLNLNLSRWLIMLNSNPAIFAFLSLVDDAGIGFVEFMKNSPRGRNLWENTTMLQNLTGNATE